MKKFEKIIPIIFLILGLIIFAYPMFLNFDRMPGNYGDARFINYILEHGFLYLTQNEIHKSFWDMPIYYPHKNTLAYSDILLGGMLFYCPIRFIFQNPQSAFQIFFLLINILNFASFYFFSRKIFKLNVLFSSFSAFFFNFCLIRHSQIEHIQLFIQFYMVLSIFCFISIKKENSKIKNKLLFIFGFIFFILQIYTTFYFGWYMCFCLPIALIAMLLSKNTRIKLKKWFTCLDKTYLPLCILGFIALIPLCYHYLKVGSMFAKAEPSSLLHLLFSHSFLDSLIIDYSYYYFPEAMLGVGLITTILIIISLFKLKNKIPVIFFIIILTSCFANKYLYSFLYDNFLPMGAIRALGRYVFVLIPIFAIALAKYLKNLKSIYIALFLMTLIIIEQIPYTNYFNWTKTGHEKRISRFELNNECKVVFYNFKKDKDFMINNQDVMWFANNNNKFCINDYSGFVFEYNSSFLDKKCFLNIK